ncbi:hypothetical protein C8J56DRAFT_928118 [Mycena floridula]|nr:hypothetical protein C8J56DRAFT_928118 [Mycena floridula]
MNSVEALAEQLLQPLNSVEIIPSDPHSDTVIVVEGHLGIQQKFLYKTYLEALILFKSPHPDQLLASSLVILVTNPAHQTALNARKRLIQSNLHSAVRELDLWTVLIRGSRECGKQSIVWDHRRWLFSQMYPPLTQSSESNDICGWPRHCDGYSVPYIPSDVVESELELLAQSCEAYPRNYHAWSHWHFCLQSVYFALQGGQGSTAYLRVVEGEFHRLKKWLDLHIKDYTAAHHLCNLVHRFSGLSIPGISLKALFDHSLALVTAYPDHEALWMYLRATLKSMDSSERISYVESLSSLASKPQWQKCLAWMNLRT